MVEERVSEELEVQLKQELRAPCIEERAALEHWGQELGVFFYSFYG